MTQSQGSSPIIWERQPVTAADASGFIISFLFIPIIRFIAIN